MWRVAVDMIVEHWACRDDMGGSSSCAIDRRAPGGPSLRWRLHTRLSRSRQGGEDLGLLLSGQAGQPARTCFGAQLGESPAGVWSRGARIG